jgi:hypothetical protein
MDSSPSLRPTSALVIILGSMCLSCVLPPVLGAGTEKMNVAPNPSFEDDLTGIQTNVCVFGGWFPIGVVTEDGQSEIRIVEDTVQTGRKSLRVTPNPKTMEGTRYYSQYNGGEEVRKNVTRRGVCGARTLAFRLDQDILSCDASVWISKAPDQEVILKAVWYTRRNRVPFIKMSEQAVTQPDKDEGGWCRYSLHAMRPHMARQVQIAVETDGAAPFHIDDVEIYLHRAAHVDILVDQLGYETQSDAKGVVLQSSAVPRRSPATFSLVSLENMEKACSGRWKELGYYPEWDLYHWEGDFSAFTKPGCYVVETTVDGDVYYSPPFEIGDDLLVPGTAEPAYRFFTYQRCGTAVPGFHAACHLDDARTQDGGYRDLAGGWHDAGDYNKYNGYTPESVYALVFAYDHRQEFFDRFDRDANGQADILDEAAWGAAFLKKCLNPETLELVNAISSGYGYWGKPGSETDNKPETGDERPVREGQGNAAACTAGFALLGKYVPEYLPLATRLYQKYGGDMATTLALYHATGEVAYRETAEKHAKGLLENNSTAGFRELAEYACAFPDDARVGNIRSVGKRRLEEIKLLCANCFRITRRQDEDGRLIFFRHYRDVNNWYVGESRELLDTAYEGILLEMLGFPEGRSIAENQVHWVLGRNPYGVSTMEGVGSVFVPQYHHRYNTLPGNPRGAVPGAVVNGITRAWPDQDRPWLDMHPEPNADYQPNEPWLPHNNRWLFLVSIW